MLRCAAEKSTCLSWGVMHHATVADSKAYLMGSNSKHQLGKDDTELVYNKPTLVSKLENFVVASLAAGWFHSVVVTD